MFPAISIAGVNADTGYKEYIKELMKKAVEGGACEEVIISIFAEPENPFDKNAIKVEINNKPVGYIPRKDQCFFDFTKYEKLNGRIESWGLHKGDSVFLWIQPIQPIIDSPKRKLRKLMLD